MRFDTSLLSSLHSSVSPSRHFKSPANSTKSPPTQFKSRGKITVRSSSSATTPSQNLHNNSLATFYGRRGLISTSALLPFLLEMSEGFGVNLQGVDASESSTIQSEIRKVLSKAKAPGVLRLVFHDAGTFDMDENLGGMNGSIVYELDRPENAGLSKSVKILEKAKGEVDKIQPVSWADMIAVAGAEAVSVCGGPIIPIQLGRLDSMVPDPKDNLPLESLDASGLKKCFLKKGFRTKKTYMVKLVELKLKGSQDEELKIWRMFMMISSAKGLRKSRTETMEVKEIKLQRMEEICRVSIDRNQGSIDRTCVELFRAKV